MQNRTNRQVSFEEVELSLQSVDKNEVVDEQSSQTQNYNSYASESCQEIVIESSQVISSSRSMPNQEQENVIHTALLMVFGVLIVVSLYAGLVFI